MSKKIVLKLEVQDDKSKQKAMKKVSSLSGVESISMDMKDKKLTVIGEVDPVHIVKKLKNLCCTSIISVGPAKEEKKKEEPKKDEPKKQEPKKDDDKIIAELVKAYKEFNPYLTKYYCVRSIEEDPNACIIC